MTYSAIIYTLRCLISEDIPLNQGCLKPVHVKIPRGSFLSPRDGAAVVGGNVLTSQRVTDVVLRAFSACAASQGCCNNLTFGIGGRRRSRRGGGEETEVLPGFGYYETIAGGSGAGPGWHGCSGVHVHMTNTRITDSEIFERRYPVLLREFGLRENTGGEGKWRGGEGVVRDIEVRRTGLKSEEGGSRNDPENHGDDNDGSEGMQVSILSERRVGRPYGMNGGGPGACGVNIWARKVRERAGGDIDDDSKEGEEKETEYRYISLSGKNTAYMRPGDRILVCTPGGGGWGSASSTSHGDAGPTSGLGTSGEDESAPDEGTEGLWPEKRQAQGEKDPRFAWRGGSIASRNAEAESSI